MVCLCLALGPARAAEEPAGKPTLEMLAWLAGSWTFERGGRTVTEQWMAPDGGTMLGMSRTVAGGKTVEHEFVLLRQDAPGNIVYVARPSGQSEAMFKLVSASATEAVFENPKHDFPQRISYTLKNDGSLLAAIEGTKAGKFRRVEFPYRRTKPAKISRASGGPPIVSPAERGPTRARPTPGSGIPTGVQVAQRANDQFQPG